MRIFLALVCFIFHFMLLGDHAAGDPQNPVNNTERQVIVRQAVITEVETVIKKSRELISTDPELAQKFLQQTLQSVEQFQDLDLKMKTRLKDILARQIKKVSEEKALKKQILSDSENTRKKKRTLIQKREDYQNKIKQDLKDFREKCLVEVIDPQTNDARRKFDLRIWKLLTEVDQARFQHAWHSDWVRKMKQEGKTNEELHAIGGHPRLYERAKYEGGLVMHHQTQPTHFYLANYRTGRKYFNPGGAERHEKERRAERNRILLERSPTARAAVERARQREEDKQNLKRWKSLSHLGQLYYLENPSVKTPVRTFESNGSGSTYLAPLQSQGATHNTVNDNYHYGLPGPYGVAPYGLNGPYDNGYD